MNKEEILNRYKQEAIDEGKNGINHYSDNKGFTSMCGLALLLIIYKIFNNQPFGDIMELLLIFLSVAPTTDTVKIISHLTYMLLY